MDNFHAGQRAWMIGLAASFGPGAMPLLLALGTLLAAMNLAFRAYIVEKLTQRSARQRGRAMVEYEERESELTARPPTSVFSGFLKQEDRRSMKQFVTFSVVGLAAFSLGRNRQKKTPPNVCRSRLKC